MEGFSECEEDDMVATEAKSCSHSSKNHHINALLQNAGLDRSVRRFLNWWNHVM